MNKEKNTDQLGKRLRRISADLKLYIEKRFELMMVNAGEYLSGWMAASVQRAAGAFLLLAGIGFLLFALAIYLGNVLESESLGYVLVSLPLLFVGLCLIYLKPQGLFEQLQQKFETEVINAINQNNESKQKKIESTESMQPEFQKDS